VSSKQGEMLVSEAPPIDPYAARAQSDSTLESPLTKTICISQFAYKPLCHSYTRPITFKISKTTKSIAESLNIHSKATLPISE